MNTIKNNFESQIKQQIEEREITPSRDLWSEIERQTENHPPKSNRQWLLIAACLVLVFSLGSVLLFYNNPKQPKLQTVQKTDHSNIEKNTEKIITESPVQIVQGQKASPVMEASRKDKKVEAVQSQVFVERKEPVMIKQDLPVLVTEVPQIPSSKIIAQSDSSKIRVKKRYVDPSTLLFSVEHKDAIEKTKGGSNVATIDLNSK